MPQVSRKQTQNFASRIIAEIEALPDRRGTGFSSFEDDMIRRFYPTKGSSGIAKVLQRTRRQISNRAHELGVKIARPNDF